MKDLLIYHPGTGTIIPLSDEVYLVDTAIAADVLDDMECGMNVPVVEHKGYRLDNFNMTNLFFGGN